uniref:Secreted protein n=1 Tax=Schistosoma curassoni TaxID=6186 RepID=A0A183KJE5_9TREM
MLLVCLFRCVTNIHLMFTIRKMYCDCICESFTAFPLCLCRIRRVFVYYDVSAVLLLMLEK